MAAIHSTTRRVVLQLFLLLLTVTASTAPLHVTPIKTVVVLVMENRSFDHMLGWMKRLNPSIDGVTGSEYYNYLSTSGYGTPKTKIFFDDGAHYVDPDPGHSFQAIREQVFGFDVDDTAGREPTMSGFAQQALSMDPTGNMSRDVMSGFHPDMVAVYRELVKEFAVFDRWFASVPASTQPNRLYVHAATSHGATSNDRGKLIKGFPQRTIFENLEDAGLSFRIYYQNIPATLFYRNLRKIKYISKFQPYGRAFKSQAARGTLPNYAVIEQRYLDSREKPATDDHPSHDVYHGQLFIKEVYETLRAGPQWNETLLIITYDEHGGFFDHVPTPNKGVPNPDGVVGEDPFYFQFDRLGVRVPTIMVSPWIDSGTVVHGPNGAPFPTSEFEHSSIPATVKKIFNLPFPFLTKRDEWAGTFEGILQTRAEPRNDCPAALPVPQRVRMGDAKEDAKLSEFQQELMQLASVLSGDHLLKDFDKFIKGMTIRQGLDYLDKAVRRFFQAGYYAKKMGVDDDQIVQMRPSLTSRSSSSSSTLP